MGSPYLKSGESIILTTDRVTVDSIAYDAMLTSRSLILIDSQYARFEPRIIALSTVQSVRSGTTATGEPVIILTVAEEGSEEIQRNILFSQQPGENRKQDRDLWVKKLMELSVSGKDEIPHKEDAPAHEREGMRPSVRRWVAPEKIHPRTGPENEPVPAVVISMDAPEPESIQKISPEITEPDQIPDTLSEEPALARGFKEVVAPALDEAHQVPQETIPDHADNTSQYPGSPHMDVAADTSGSLSSIILAAAKSLTDRDEHDELKEISVRVTSPLPEKPESGPISECNDEVVSHSQTDAPNTDDQEQDSGKISVSDHPSSLHTDIQIPPPDADIPVPALPRMHGSRTSEPAFEPHRDMELEKPAGDTRKAKKGEHRHTTPSPSLRSPPYDRSILITCGAILCIILAIIGIQFLPGMVSHDNGSSTVVPTVGPVTTIMTTPVQTPAAYMQDGIWVRIVSPGHFIGRAGSVGYLQQASGSGEKYVKVLNRDNIISVSVEKTENTGDELLVEIYRDGSKIASRSTTAPMGSVDLLIDPATGKAPGMAAPDPANVTAAPTGKLEYY